MTKNKGIKIFDELIEKEHVKIGTESRNEYEEGAQMFIVSISQVGLELLQTTKLVDVKYFQVKCPEEVTDLKSHYEMQQIQSETVRILNKPASHM
jgi:hypothetical protein